MIDPKSDKTSGYHLFLMPQGEVGAELKKIISRLAHEYDGLDFVPHVTILARIVGVGQEEVLQNAQEVARGMKAFSVSLGGIGMEDIYFRSLYIRAEKSEELSALHERALEFFDMRDESSYMPHVSLFYGNVSVETKEAMIQSLVMPENLSFTVDKIHVYKTEGSAREWIPVGEVALQ